METKLIPWKCHLSDPVCCHPNKTEQDMSFTESLLPQKWGWVVAPGGENYSRGFPEDDMIRPCLYMVWFSRQSSIFWKDPFSPRFIRNRLRMRPGFSWVWNRKAQVKLRYWWVPADWPCLHFLCNFYFVGILIAVYLVSATLFHAKLLKCMLSV